MNDLEKQLETASNVGIKKLIKSALSATTAGAKKHKELTSFQTEHCEKYKTDLVSENKVIKTDLELFIEKTLSAVDSVSNETLKQQMLDTIPPIAAQSEIAEKAKNISYKNSLNFINTGGELLSNVFTLYLLSPDLGKINHNAIKQLVLVSVSVSDMGPYAAVSSGLSAIFNRQKNEVKSADVYLNSLEDYILTIDAWCEAVDAVLSV